MPADTVIQFGATFLDSEEQQAQAQAHLYVDGANPISDVTDALAAWAGAMDLLSGAKIMSTRAKIVGPGVANGAKPIAGSEVQEVGIFDFTLGATPYVWGAVVPAILETLTVGGGKINPSATDVHAFITLMQAAVAGGHYTGLNQDTLSAFRRSLQGNRARRRQFSGTVNYSQPT